MNLSKSFATTVVSIVYAIDLREASKSFFMESVRKEVEGYTHSVAHAVMNIDENLSVTKNLFLPDSLEDWVHG